MCVGFVMAYPQRQNWQGNDSGILRKKDENEEELLVFGYSCKLFRDDEKALYVDQGKHLIPWMGDDSLRIDRYDVRGALYDLSQYEAISGQQQEELFWVNLSSEERKIEQLCDEERYRALTHNEDEERLYQEEELKRLHQALGSDKTYGQVSYSYDEESGEPTKPSETNQSDEADEPFVPSLELNLPSDMVVPDTIKLNAIIEKTVMFIHQQGLQMEIILKMKQASNPQFEFLSYNSQLHSYYRHVLNAVKSGKYKPKPCTTNTIDNQTEENNEASENYYLHHSLSSQPPISTFNLAPSIPTINYKPSSDCAYSMLVNKIKNNQNKLLSRLTDDGSSNEPTDLGGVSDRLDSTPPKSVHSENVLVENDCSNRLPQRYGRRKRRKRQQGGFAYNDSIEAVESPDNTEYNNENVTAMEEKMELTDVVEVPPVDLQLIIDKMASYVGKNGRNFEDIVHSKNDPRFSFLDPLNTYHVYYRKKVELFEQKQTDGADCKVTSILNEDENNDLVENGNESSVSHTQSTKVHPVSFSIKRPKETESLEIKSALPVEESTDDEKYDNEENSCNQEAVDVNTVTTDTAHKVDSVSEQQVTKQISGKFEDHTKTTELSKEREKQLQLERKKRAAAFLNLIQRATKKPESNESVVIGPQLPDDMKPVKFGSESDDDDSELASSPPSSVTSPDVTVVEDTVVASPKHKLSDQSASSAHKYLKYSEKKSSRRDKDVAYRHKHRKRKRSHTPSRKHHLGRWHYHHKEEVKKKKHRRLHREKERGCSGSSSVVTVSGRRHKHSKLRKRLKRKDEKKYYESNKSSSPSENSDSE